MIGLGLETLPRSLNIADALFNEFKTTNFTDILFCRKTWNFILCSSLLNSCMVYTWKENKLHSKQMCILDIDFEHTIYLYSLDYDE